MRSDCESCGTTQAVTVKGLQYLCRRCAVFLKDILESKNADKSLAEPFVFEGEDNDN